ncbi:hypothetical protein NBRC116492_35300 [Aurantivibrio infirmus]
MRISIVVLTLFTICSCATQLTGEGESVKIVTENQKEKQCESIKLISVRAGTGPDKPGSALRKALNETASLGANGFYILSQNLDWAIGATVTGEALRCDF